MLLQLIISVAKSLLFRRFDFAPSSVAKGRNLALGLRSQGYGCGLRSQGYGCKNPGCTPPSKFFAVPAGTNKSGSTDCPSRLDKQRFLTPGHQGWNDLHRLCRIGMEYYLPNNDNNINNSNNNNNNNNNNNKTMMMMIIIIRMMTMMIIGTTTIMIMIIIKRHYKRH